MSSKMRSLGISLLSLALTTTVIANAYYQKKQFYPSVVYITKSNPSMAVIYIQAFICVILAGKLMRRIFFGELRTTEFEHLMERSWYAITETCLAFTVFRDDFNPKFVALFTLLLFLKSFHWLAEDRVDYMERSPVISWLFHIRVVSLVLVLGLLDTFFVEHAYFSTVNKGASVQLVFGFEYAILLTMVINIAIKYILYIVDINSETPWDNKAVFLLYTELIMGFIKVCLYVAFVAIMVRIYTLPLFALRPMYYTIRNFKKAFNDVILSRRAIHNMNTLYPDATQEELQNGDNVCIICREEMSTGAKKLPCNHIFHAACLRSWFQRQQTCPTCRLNILQTPTQADQRQQRPPIIPNAPNIMNPFGGPNPFQMLNPNLFNQNILIPNVRNNAQPQAPTPTPTPNVAPNANMQPPNNNMPPFPFPPFPFMTPFMTAPPMPPTSLANLTTEQLQRLEGTERENIEARIQWLRNVQVMLDTATIMMQQYNTAAALSMPIPSTSRDATTSETMCNGTATPTTSNAHLDTTRPTTSTTTVATSPVNSTVNVGVTTKTTSPGTTARASSTPSSSIASSPSASAASASSTSLSSTPVGSTPVSSTPVGSTPVSSTLVRSTPVSSTPLSSAPVSSTPVSSTSVSSTPHTSTLASSTLASSTLASSTLASSTLASSTPFSSTTISSTPVSSTPVSSTPVSLTPVGSTSTSSTLVSSATTSPGKINSATIGTPTSSSAKSSTATFPKSQTEANASLSPEEEIRRRRIQKFGQQVDE